MRQSHAAALAAQLTTASASGETTTTYRAANVAARLIPAIICGIPRIFEGSHNATPRAFSALWRREQCYAGTEYRTHGQPGHEV